MTTVLFAPSKNEGGSGLGHGSTITGKIFKWNICPSFCVSDRIMSAHVPGFSTYNPWSWRPAWEHRKPSPWGHQRGGEGLKVKPSAGEFSNLYRETTVWGIVASQQDSLQAEYLHSNFLHSLVVRTAHHSCANLHIHTDCWSLPRRSLKILVLLASVGWAGCHGIINPRVTASWLIVIIAFYIQCYIAGSSNLKHSLLERGGKTRGLRKWIKLKSQVGSKPNEEAVKTQETLRASPQSYTGGGGSGPGRSRMQLSQSSGWFWARIRTSNLNAGSWHKYPLESREVGQALDICHQLFWIPQTLGWFLGSSYHVGSQFSLCLDDLGQPGTVWVRLTHSFQGTRDFIKARG
jgi:hypothetical protein